MSAYLHTKFMISVRIFTIYLTITYWCSIQWEEDKEQGGIQCFMLWNYEKLSLTRIKAELADIKKKIKNPEGF